MNVIPLTQGYDALVDDADYVWLAQWKWFAKIDKENRNVYAARNIRIGPRKQTTIRMHRVIMSAEGKSKVDHIDGNGLNNQRFNLRTATNQQNCQNKKKRRDGKVPYKGVSIAKRCTLHPYKASIFVAGKTKSLGLFKTPEEAAEEYNHAACHYFGEFARLNVIPPKE